jgi:dephospho-CoA kinase
MLQVGLTGNVASGKTSVARLFERWGATLIDADAIVHQLQQPGTAVFEAIVARFGPGVVAPDGELDRKALGRIVFADPAALAALNAIVHPAVAARRDELMDAAAQGGAAIVVQDIPLLFEVLDPAAFDAIVLVDAPVAHRRERLIRERHLSAAEADRMIAAQLPSEAKRARSHHVIDNDGDLATLERQARTVWGQLRHRAAASA